jgi:hypothetical protein
MAKQKLFSGRVKVTPAANVAADRYNYLALEQAEPNLGVANTDGMVLTYSTSAPGNRLWANSSISSTDNVARAQATSSYLHSNAAFDKANTASKSTASTTAPGSPTIGDMWYDTETDVLLRYTYDGTSNNWIDITGPIIRSTYVRPTYLITANAS